MGFFSSSFLLPSLDLKDGMSWISGCISELASGLAGSPTKRQFQGATDRKVVGSNPAPAQPVAAPSAKTLSPHCLVRV